MHINKLVVIGVSLVLWLAGGGCGGSGKNGGTGGAGGSGGWDSGLPGFDGGKAIDADNSLPVAESVLFKMESVQGVGRNPPVATSFTLARSSYVTRVMTYHYTEVIGTRHPTVSLQDTTTGKTYGPWAQIGYSKYNTAPGVGADDPSLTAGPPDHYWVAYPGEMIPAGTYQVIDSDPKTWCYTADLGNRGVAWVWGWYGGMPTATVDGGSRIDAAVDASVVDGGSPDAEVIVTRPLIVGTVTSAPVAPSAVSTTTPLGPGVAITVAGGFLSATATFSSAPVLQTPRNITGPTQMLGAFELTCSGCPTAKTDGGLAPDPDAGAADGGASSAPMVIELSYDPALLDPGLEEGKGIFVATWDVEGQGWITVPFQVDTVRKKLLVPTNHLSTWVYWTVKGYKVITTEEGHFDVYYNPKHTVPLTDNSETDMRAFAKRVGAIMEVAYGRYKTAGFKMPWYVFTSTIKVVITEDLRWVWETWNLYGYNPRYVSQGATTPYYSAATGNVCLKLSELVTDDKIRTTGAHELFHAIQNQYTNIYTMGNKLWWYEGTPDYAAYAIAWQKSLALTNYFEPTPVDYFLNQLNLNEGTHAYQMVRFLNYLDEKQSVDFKALWDAAMGKSDPLVGFESYVTSKGGSTFSAMWRNYVAWMYFDPSANMVPVEGMKAFPQNTTSATYQFPSLPGSYSAAAMYFRPQFTGGTTSRTLTISAPSDLPSDTVLELWRLPNGLKVAGGASLLGVLEGSTRSQTVVANPGDQMYVLAMNTGKNERTLSVTATEVLPNKDAGVADSSADAAGPVTNLDSAVKGNWSISLAFKGTGTGQVFATPADSSGKGETCTKGCTITREDGYAITLYATADSTSGFIDWGTIACSKGTATYNPYGCGSSFGDLCTSWYATNGAVCTLSPTFSLKN